MKVAGIICEYNPFHRAHARHIAWTRETLGGRCAVVCVMSGNYVQRGEPAVFEKHARAAAAVRCGADLVLELPLPWAVSTAEVFARGGVSLLNSLGICTHLSFGSEAGDLADLMSVAQCLRAPEMDEGIRKGMKSGISYAAARYQTAEALLGEKAALLRQPNNILAVSYLDALWRLDSAMEPVTFPRQGPEHDGLEAEERMASASYIRDLLRLGGLPWLFLEDEAAAVFQKEMQAGRGPVSPADSETALLARLRTLPEESFANLPDDAEGLSRRLLRFAHTAPDLRTLLHETKSKRYALSRIRRMVLSAYLGIQAGDSAGAPPYARVLAFNKTGQKLLRDVGKTGTVPVVTKPASARELPETAARIFALEAQSTDLYVLGYRDPQQRVGGQEWRLSPVRIG